MMHEQGENKGPAYTIFKLSLCNVVYDSVL